MSKLSRSIIYKNFRKTLIDQFGSETAGEIWTKADGILGEWLITYPHMDRNSRMMVLPAAALYKVLVKAYPEEALPLLKAYGTKVGEKIASIVHAVTSIPGLSGLLWKNMPKLMRKMSSPEEGYTREIISETSELVGVDILSCPLHDAAVKIGVPQAAQVVCAMDKAYMTGFRYIEYTRTTSVAEGDRCCDYRLRYDRKDGKRK